MLRTAPAVLMAILALPVAATAQPCTNAQAAAKEGRWVVEPEAAAFDTDVPQLRRQYPSLAGSSDRAIALLQQAAPSPRGVDVKVNRLVTGPSLTGAGHVRYSVNAAVFSWFCVPSTRDAGDNAGKVLLGDESSGKVTIWFNATGSLTNERRRVADLQTPDGQQIFYAMTQRDSLRGEALYDLNVFAPRADRALVLTSDGASVWRSVTRDELLGARIAFAQARVDTMRAGLARLQAVPDTSRVMPEARRTLRLLEADVQALASARSALSPEERDQPAIVQNPYAPPATLFVSAANGGKGLVVLRRGILTRGRPRTEVGLITVEWSWTPGDSAQVDFMRQFTERLDVAALRQMLTRP